MENKQSILAIFHENSQKKVKPFWLFVVKTNPKP